MMQSMNQVQCCSCNPNMGMYVNVMNNGNYMARLSIRYMDNCTQGVVNSGPISGCQSKKIYVPSTDGNLQVCVEACNCCNWMQFYNENISASGNGIINLQLSGTGESPICNVMGGSTGNVGMGIPSLTVTKTINPPSAGVAKCITSTTNITNSGDGMACGVRYVINFDTEGIFIPGSLMINGVQSCVSCIPANGICIGNIMVGQTVTVEYQQVFNTIPTQNIIKINPIVNYSYTDANGQSQMKSITGTTQPLTLIPEYPPMYDPCCCSPCYSTCQDMCQNMCDDTVMAEQCIPMGSVCSTPPSNMCSPMMMGQGCMTISNGSNCNTTNGCNLPN